MTTIVLLTLSNVFMTFAWYGHLKYKHSLSMPAAVLASWLIAFFEYCFQVPANRYGSETFTTPQLKIIQEAITLVVFSIFSVLWLKERLRWNDLAGFACVMAAVVFVFAFRPPAKGATPAAPADPGTTTASLESGR